jgi:hypothetical protein
MPDQMPANSERDASGDLFGDLAETLKQLRAAASPPPAPPESWLKKTLSPAAPSTHQSEFNLALVDALTQLLSALRETAATQEKRLAQLEEELPELRAISENLDAFREHSVRMEGELRSMASSVRGLHERSAALETELAQAREQLAGEQGDLRREIGERIQHLLDEQRVCIRQLSLQASEEAILADRARRATELKLDELARRLPPPPA